jgi:hypothetical protein
MLWSWQAGFKRSRSPWIADCGTSASDRVTSVNRVQSLGEPRAGPSLGAFRASCKVPPILQPR